MALCEVNIDYTNKNKPKDGGLHFAAAPEPKTSEPMQEMGAYTLTCKNKPELKTQFFVVDNPYVFGGGYGASGSFSINGVPPGKYSVDVWHPLYEPVLKQVDVQIEPDKTTEMVIQFKPPVALMGN